MRATPPPCLASHAWKIRLVALFEKLQVVALFVKVRIVALVEKRVQMYMELEFIKNLTPLVQNTLYNSIGNGVGFYQKSYSPHPTHAL